MKKASKLYGVSVPVLLSGTCSRVFDYTGY